MEYYIPDRNATMKSFEPMDDDDLIVCRCEEITKGEIRKAVHIGMMTVNDVKRFLRPGMGLCQGLTCGRNVKDIIARELKINAVELEEITPRPPARPMSAKIYGNIKEGGE